MDELEAHLALGTPFERLPAVVQQLLGYNVSEYNDSKIQYSIRFAYSWHPSLEPFIEELDYYVRLISFFRQHRRLYPYSLLTTIVQHNLPEPFAFYISMLDDMLRTELSYDQLPNFSAVDVLRWTGVGRNEYIDMMNQCRTRRIMWKINKHSVTHAVLPKVPLPNVNIISREDIHLNAKVSLPPTLLQGFVLNRSAEDNEDPFEKLLYDCLHTMDKRTSVGELSAILGRPVEEVQDAIAIYKMFGMATLFVDECQENAEELDNKVVDFQESVVEEKKRVGLLYDGYLAAVLMAGSIVESLKEHAVALYEAGKLTDDQMDRFVVALDSMASGEWAEAMGGGEDIDEYVTVSGALASTIRYVRGEGYALDMLRGESLKSLDPAIRMRILEKQYSVLMPVIPMSPLSLRLEYDLPHFIGGPKEWNTPWTQLFLFSLLQTGPKSLFLPHGTVVRTVPKHLGVVERERSAARCRIIPWNCEGIDDVKVSHLLPFLRQFLRKSSVLLYVVSNNEEDISEEEVIFPLEYEEMENEIKKENSGKDVREMTRRLIHLLHLDHSFGTVKWITICGKWLPVRIRFGMPVCDRRIQGEICDVIRRKELFSDKSLSLHGEDMTLLSEELRSFVTHLGAEEFSPPSCPVVFDNNSCEGIIPE